MKIEKAKFNMIEQQVRTWEVLDNEILDVMRSIPREEFVPKEYRKLAYADAIIPIACDEQMLVPREVGRALQALAIKKTDSCLEIGTGTGYVTSLIATLTNNVTTVEIHDQLLEQAKNNCKNFNNIEFINANAFEYYNAEEFDVICITGSMPNLPEQFKKQVKIGGRIFAIIGTEPSMQAMLFTRIESSQWLESSLFETVVKPLHKIPFAEIFEF